MTVCLFHCCNLSKYLKSFFKSVPIRKSSLRFCIRFYQKLTVNLKNQIFVAVTLMQIENRQARWFRRKCMIFYNFIQLRHSSICFWLMEEMNMQPVWENWSCSQFFYQMYIRRVLVYSTTITTKNLEKNLVSWKIRN